MYVSNEGDLTEITESVPSRVPLGDDVLNAWMEVLASYLSSQLLIMLGQAQGRQPKVMTGL